MWLQEMLVRWKLLWTDAYLGTGTVLWCRVVVDKDRRQQVLEALDAERFSVRSTGSLTAIDVSDGRVLAPRRSRLRGLRAEVAVLGTGRTARIPSRHPRSLERRLRSVLRRAEPDVGRPIQGVVAEEVTETKRGPFDLRTTGGVLIASRLRLGSGQGAAELVASAATGWRVVEEVAPSPPTSGARVGVVAVVLAVPTWILLAGAQRGAWWFWLVMIALACLLACHYAPRVALPGLQVAIGTVAASVVPASFVGTLVARHAYDMFAGRLGIPVGLLGLSWPGMAQAQASLLIKRLVVLALMAYGILVLFESYAAGARPGHVLRWRRAGVLVALAAVLIASYSTWQAAGDGGRTAAEAVLRSQAPPASQWLRGVDVRAATLRTPGSACTSQDTPLSSGLMLGIADGRVAMLVPVHEGYRIERILASVEICQEGTIAPAGGGVK